jgi:hypothetical protein
MIAIFIVCITTIVSYLISEKLKETYVGKTVYWAETTTVDENTANTVCKTGRVISVEKSACIQLESKDLVFIDKQRLFLEKWRLKKSIGMDLTRSELLDSFKPACHW